MKNIDSNPSVNSSAKPPRLPIPLPNHTPTARQVSVSIPVNIPPPPGSQPMSMSERPLVSGHFGSAQAQNRVITHIPEIHPLSESELISRELSLHAVPFNSEIRRLIRSEAPSSVVQRLMKRLLDLSGSLIGIVLLSPFFFLLALAIKLDSRGPIIFSQTRVGKNGRLFKFYKFRSMVTNAERLKKTLMTKNEADGPAFKMKHDPRVTRIGRFIRKTSLDEMPQLWNVLRGDMSLVGPRPALPDEVEKWKPWQHKRLAVEQGCTCIWQVSGRSDVNFDQWMRMDLEYVRSWSLRLDLSIIVRTVFVMLTGKGAY